MTQMPGCSFHQTEISFFPAECVIFQSCSNISWAILIQLHLPPISAKAQDDCTWGVVMLPQQEEDVALVESRTARPEAQAEQGFSQRAAELHVAAPSFPTHSYYLGLSAGDLGCVFFLLFTQPLLARMGYPPLKITAYSECLQPLGSPRRKTSQASASAASTALR